MRCELCGRDLDPKGTWTQAVTVDPGSGHVTGTTYYCAGRACQADAQRPAPRQQPAVS